MAAATVAALLAQAPADAATTASRWCGPRTSPGAASALSEAASAAQHRPRVIISSDGEIDDQASFHRFLLYTNDLDVEGITLSSSRFHWAGNGSTIPAHNWRGTTWTTDMINGGYARAYPELVRHDRRYPKPADLVAIERVGNIENVGDMAADTPASDLMKRKLLDDEPGPLWLDVWGGTNTVARALKSIQDQYQGTPEWPFVYRKVSDKAVIYIILDQDTTYKDYIAENWPDVRVIMNNEQFEPFAYKWKSRVPGALQTYFQGPWMTENIVRGPLNQDYPVGPRRAGGVDFGPGEFVSEGDSPSFFQHIPTGLRSAEDPALGGWAGRFVQVGPRLWTDKPSYLGRPGDQVTDLNPDTGQKDKSYPQARWTADLQNDFAARVDWTTADRYDQANHRPVAYVPPGLRDIGVKPGQTVHLRGVTADPDGNTRTCTWWQYQEAGSYPGVVTLTGATGGHPSFVVPEDAKRGQRIHIVFQVTDTGTPPLTSYQRVIATVR
ncbi:nucleoside hydrolase-like domain-containing protein [Actinomadura sp. NPDC000600]|uniref:DUF1593 domain-containing protein n=1 Tax=Actinomadura sp. NPDC000600 TaxID=3154262 RepID=UPI003391C7B7